MFFCQIPSSSQKNSLFEILEFYLRQIFGPELLLNLANQRMPRKRKNASKLLFLSRFKMVKAGLYGGDFLLIFIFCKISNQCFLAAVKNDAATRRQTDTVTRQKFEDVLPRVLADIRLAGKPAKEQPQPTAVSINFLSLARLGRTSNCCSFLRSRTF